MKQIITTERTFKPGQKVAILRQGVGGSFHGHVVQTRPGWVRVAGPGSFEGSTFDEWFPIETPKTSVHLMEAQ